MEIPDSTALARDLAPAGVLRASVNLGNPVLAQGSPDAPRGVTVDLAGEIARRLGLPVEFLCFDAARKSYEAMTTGRAVPAGSTLRTPEDVDRPGIRIGVKQGSAYDLYLTRTLRHATVVRGPEGVDTFHAERLEAAAGIRQPLTAHLAERPELRLIEPAFMTIRQAIGTTKTRRPETLRFLSGTVAHLTASGFVAEALRRSGQNPALAAPTER